MELVFLLKPFVDMLYEYQVLDVLLMAICLLYFFFSFYKLSLKRIDKLVILLMVLFFLSFVRNFDGWPQFLKIESSFILYFLGRSYYTKIYRTIKYIKKGFLPVMAFSILAFITGLGFVYWGNVNTFRGFYYFKTDLALAMTQCFILCSFGCRNDKISYLISIFCILFIIISNARIYYFIILLYMLFAVCYSLEKKRNRVIIKINGKWIVVVFILIIVTALVMIWINSLIGGDYLLLDTSNGLYSEANTQGRSVVWAEIISIFINQDSISQLFGIDLCSDISPSTGFNSHNVFLKVLFSTGYVGLLFFVIFLIKSLKLINSLRNRRLFYIVLCFLLTFIIGGISYITIESTQASWLTMLFIGSSVSYSHKMNETHVVR